MELLVATWTLRLTLVAAGAVGAAGLAAGSAPIEIAQRITLVAFLLTLGGRWLVGALEAPEKRLRRLRGRRIAALEHADAEPGQPIHPATGAPRSPLA